MRKIFSFLGALATLVMIVACDSTTLPVEDDGINGFVLKRGTNLSHWLSQSEARGEERRKHIQDDDFERLASMGFDHVRIPIDEVQFWDENGNKLQEAWDILTSSLDMARKHNIRAIVDLHIIRSHYFGAKDGENQLFSNPEAQKRLLEMWRELSHVLRDYSTDWVAYEFMNEPVAPDPEQWNELIAKLYLTLRVLEPNRTLVIGSNMWQNVQTFKDLRVPKGDKNIILSFHYYHPMPITHRFAWWTPVGKYEGEVHYPGQLYSQEVFDAMPEDIKNSMREGLEEWGPEKIYAQIKDAIDVAAKYDLQLFCGEWGVYEKVERNLAYAWTKDMIEVFDKFNIAWTTWCYDGDFGFYSQKTESIKDQGLVDILSSGH